VAEIALENYVAGGLPSHYVAADSSQSSSHLAYTHHTHILPLIDITNMCIAGTCQACHKKSWYGCGRHVPAVMDGVPDAERWSSSTPVSNV
jgi:hypothetical protein